MLDKSAEQILDRIQPQIATLPASGIIEVVNYGRKYDDLIKLYVGEGNKPTPDFINDAAVAALRDGRTFYTWQRGLPPLRDALGSYLTNLYDTPVDRERIFVTVGGMQAVVQTMQMLVGDGANCVVPTPVWPNIYHAVQMVGGTSTKVPLELGNDGWRLDVDKLLDAVGPDTRSIYINSPGNPTGWVMSRDDMIRVRDFARERGIWIVSDEVYGRFTYDDRGNLATAPSFLQIMEPDERLIVINTFSKNWAMSGWRIGWLVAPVALGQTYESLIQYNTSGVAEFLQHGALAAVRDGEPFIAQVLEQSRKGREIVCRRFAEFSRVRFAPPAGAFYLFFAVEGETDSRQLALRIIDECHVGLAPGSAFGPGGEAYVRLCFATSPDHLEDGIDRLAKVLG